MSKSEIQAILTRLDLHPSRRLGQNFLCDGNLLHAMVRDAAPQAGEALLEIGPGTGVLTTELLAAGSRVTAVEIDHRLCDYLAGHFRDNPSLRLVRADACQLDYDDLMGSAPYRCIANLPYAVSTVVLARLCDAANPPQACFILLQREMAERLSAPPRCKAYGCLSVHLRLLYDVHVLRRVPAQVFLPPPDVESAFVRLQRRPDAAAAPERRLAVELARTAFGQRRKRLLKNLAGRWPRERLAAAFQQLGLGDDVRAEELAPDDFTALARLL